MVKCTRRRSIDKDEEEVDMKESEWSSRSVGTKGESEFI